MHKKPPIQQKAGKRKFKRRKSEVCGLQVMRIHRELISKYSKELLGNLYFRIILLHFSVRFAFNILSLEAYNILYISIPLSYVFIRILNKFHFDLHTLCVCRTFFCKKFRIGKNRCFKTNGESRTRWIVARQFSNERNNYNFYLDFPNFMVQSIR